MKFKCIALVASIAAAAPVTQVGTVMVATGINVAMSETAEAGKSRVERRADRNQRRAARQIRRAERRNLKETKEINFKDSTALIQSEDLDSGNRPQPNNPPSPTPEGD